MRGPRPVSRDLRTDARRAGRVQGLAVDREQGFHGLPFLVMPSSPVHFTPREQLATCRGPIAGLRHRDEQVPAKEPDCVFHMALFVSGGGVAERGLESVVCLTPLEEFGEAERLLNPATDAPGIVEDDTARRAAHVMPDIYQPVHDTLGSLAAKELQVAGIAVGTRDAEEVDADGPTAFADTGGAEIHLGFAGVPR